MTYIYSRSGNDVSRPGTSLNQGTSALWIGALTAPATGECPAQGGGNEIGHASQLRWPLGRLDRLARLRPYRSLRRFCELAMTGAATIILFLVARRLPAEAGGVGARPGLGAAGRFRSRCRRAMTDPMDRAPWHRWAALLHPLVPAQLLRGDPPVPPPTMCTVVRSRPGSN